MNKFIIVSFCLLICIINSCYIFDKQVLPSKEREGASYNNFLWVTYHCPGPENKKAIDLIEPYKEIILVGSKNESIMNDVIKALNISKNYGKCKIRTNDIINEGQAALVLQNITEIETRPFGSKYKVNGTEVSTDTTKCIAAKLKFKVYTDMVDFTIELEQNSDQFENSIELLKQTIIEDICKGKVP